MAGSDDKSHKIAVNGSTSGYTPSVQDDITIALLANGGIQRIQKSFQQRLDETGWSQRLREYVERLFRAGDAITYEDALQIVMQQVVLQAPGAEETGARSGKRVNGETSTGPELVVPREAARGAAETVKKELANVVKMEK